MAVLIDFFFTLKKYEVPVSIRELLDLLGALEKHLVFASMEDFYFLARLILVKDEKYYDRFDQVFSYYFRNIETADLKLDNFIIPKEWLMKKLERFFTPEQLAAIKRQGDLKTLIDLFNQRLKEQKERHQGGNRWIGTGGTSPFGAYGYNPAGFRMGQDKSVHRRALKVWDKRQFRDLDESNQLSSRSMQVALKRLRLLAKNQSNEVLDLEATIRATAKNAGFLSLQNTYERRNAVKVLLLFDIGGSMDDFISLSRNLFQAARNSFKDMELFYFHNFPYEYLWRNNQRRAQEGLALFSLLNKYNEEYKLILVGDATMAPEEITVPGGSVEHFNGEPGSFWLQKLRNHFKKSVWLNPVEEAHWCYTPSILITQQLMEGQMYPMSTEGIVKAMKALL